MRKLAAVSAFLLLTLGGAATAAQTNAGFLIRINIQTSCTVIASNLNFGNIGLITGGETASATVNVNCSPGTSYLGQMSNGPNNVNYSAAFSASGDIGPGTYAIDGVIAAQATPPPASTPTTAPSI